MSENERNERYWAYFKYRNIEEEKAKYLQKEIPVYKKGMFSRTIHRRKIKLFDRDIGIYKKIVFSE